MLLCAKIVSLVCVAVLIFIVVVDAVLIFVVGVAILLFSLVFVIAILVVIGAVLIVPCCNGIITAVGVAILFVVIIICQ